MKGRYCGRSGKGVLADEDGLCADGVVDRVVFVSNHLLIGRRGVGHLRSWSSLVRRTAVWRLDILDALDA